MTRTNYAIAAVMAVGCFLTLLGPALPMLVIKTVFVSRIQTGYGQWGSYGKWRFGPFFEAIIDASMLLTLVVIALFVLTLITKRWHLLVKIGLVLFCTMVTLIQSFFVGTIMSMARDLDRDVAGVAGAGVWAGVGVWVFILGGICMLAASIWGSVKWNAAISEAT